MDGVHSCLIPNEVLQSLDRLDSALSFERGFKPIEGRDKPNGGSAFPKLKPEQPGLARENEGGCMIATDRIDGASCATSSCPRSIPNAFEAPRLLQLSDAPDVGNGALIPEMKCKLFNYLL